MFLSKKKIIDLNEYTPKEMEANVENCIRQYHDNRHKNKIFRELSKIDNYLVQLRKAGLSFDYIRQFLLDYFDYKVGVHTLSDYYKVFHHEPKAA